MDIKPKLRKDIGEEIAKILENQHCYWFKTCVNCDNWDEEKETCKKYNSRPPARVIAYGCDDFSDDLLIPF